MNDSCLEASKRGKIWIIYKFKQCIVVKYQYLREKIKLKENYIPYISMNIMLLKPYFSPIPYN